jgi:tRNA modification GTPase
MSDWDTIAAQATPLGKGGIGVIRVSGTQVRHIAAGIVGQVPKPRFAAFSTFLDHDRRVIDHGLALFFPGPNSFTGEDVLELQGHGGPVVMNLLLGRVLSLGARLARPGEFSERAFLNNKIDLSQAEAIADLIDSASSQAAQSAMRSLSGEFSRRVHGVTESLTQFRVFVEAAIDFPDEEIDFLADEGVSRNLSELQNDLTALRQQANQGAILNEGVSIVFAGRPNAGKSSLMNALTGRDTSIVTDVAGTTRDIINEHVHLDGIPVRLIDTAGLRDSGNAIEQEGVRRAIVEIEQADYVLLIVDLLVHGQNLQQHVNELKGSLPENARTLVVLNKCDLCELPDALEDEIVVSAVSGEGIEVLKARLKEGIGFEVGNEGTFMARTRHLQALDTAIAHLDSGVARFRLDQAGELLAEELRYCQQSLGEITGEFTNDDLLGQIFASFCIGK